MGWEFQDSLTCLNGANKAYKKSSCVVQRQVKVDDITCCDTGWWQNSQSSREAVLIYYSCLGETWNTTGHRQHKSGKVKKKACNVTEGRLSQQTEGLSNKRSYGNTCSSRGVNIKCRAFKCDMWSEGSRQWGVWCLIHLIREAFYSRGVAVFGHQEDNDALLSQWGQHILHCFL